MEKTADEFVEFDHCPLCNSDSSQFRRLTTKGDHFTQENCVFCLNCSLVFLTPRLSSKSLRAFYLNDTFSQQFRGASAPDAEATRYRDERAARRWQYLQGSLPRHASCLEIGCSSGNFLRQANAAGHAVVGIDPSTGYASFAREQGLDVHCGTFPDDLPQQQEPFGAIVSFHVIEHVEDPLRMLRSIRQRIDERGVLGLEYPDVELAANRPALHFKYFQKSHLYDFNFHTITLLLKLAGFEVLRSFTEREAPLDKNRLLVARPCTVLDDMIDPSWFHNPTAPLLFEHLLRKLAAAEGKPNRKRWYRLPTRVWRRIAG